MRMQFSQLKSLPVVTETGHFLGKVSDLILDVDRHSVLKYLVSPGLLKTKLTIDASQIVHVTDREIMVKDLIKGTKSPAKVLKNVKPHIANPAMRKNQ